MIETALQLLVGLVWVAAVHKTYLDACRPAVRWVRVTETSWRINR